MIKSYILNKLEVIVIVEVVVVVVVAVEEELFFGNLNSGPTEGDA